MILEHFLDGILYLCIHSMSRNLLPYLALILIFTGLNSFQRIVCSTLGGSNFLNCLICQNSMHSTSTLSTNAINIYLAMISTRMLTLKPTNTHSLEKRTGLAH
uniref:Uncharacterized protein n=1 Tax=Cacopsylla melanoneura TaxID=428564 RepID=A0A8D8U024_9HEMI